MEYHKDQYWAPSYLFSMSMIFRDHLIFLFSILFADDASVFIEGHSYQEVIEIQNKGDILTRFQIGLWQIN